MIPIGRNESYLTVTRISVLKQLVRYIRESIISHVVALLKKASIACLPLSFFKRIHKKFLNIFQVRRILHRCELIVFYKLTNYYLKR